MAVAVAVFATTPVTAAAAFLAVVVATVVDVVGSADGGVICIDVVAASSCSVSHRWTLLSCCTADSSSCFAGVAAIGVAVLVTCSFDSGVTCSCCCCCSCYLQLLLLILGVALIGVTCSCCC